MIAFLDTSALVPLLIKEQGSTRCRAFWEAAEVITGSRFLFVEAAAALSRAERMGRMNHEAHMNGLALLESLWAQIDAVEASDLVVRRAAVLADVYGLRGYDAVHCSAAVAVQDRDMVAASGDVNLLAAWDDLGISTFNPNDAP